MLEVMFTDAVEDGLLKFAVTYGMLDLAEVRALGELPPEMEIGEIMISEKLPESLTYPRIQPELYEKATDYLKKL